jgi:hypothetical protein
VSIHLKDFLPDEMIALIFELQFKCEIQGHLSQYVCLGYQTYMPDIDTIGKPVDGLIQLKLNKGPDESLD